MDKTGAGGTIQEWKKAKKEKLASKKPDRPFFLGAFAMFIAMLLIFNAITWMMVDVYHRSTLKRVIRIEKKLNAANKQIKWTRQALGVTVKGRVKKDSRLDNLDKFLTSKEK